MQAPCPALSLQCEWALCWGAGSPGVGTCSIGFPTLHNCKAWHCPPAPPRITQAHPLFDRLTQTDSVLHSHCAPGIIPVKAACIKCYYCYLAFLASPLQLSPPSILQPEHLLYSITLFIFYLWRIQQVCELLIFKENIFNKWTIWAVIWGKKQTFLEDATSLSQYWVFDSFLSVNKQQPKIGLKNFKISCF